MEQQPQPKTIEEIVYHHQGQGQVGQRQDEMEGKLEQQNQMAMMNGHAGNGGGQQRRGPMTATAATGGKIREKWENWYSSINGGGAH